TLKPDIAFFGFALTEEHARGHSTEPGQGDPGWFFVLQEQPGEPRFGLDESPGGQPPVLRTWDDLTWGHLGANVTYIDLSRAVGPPTQNPKNALWGSDAAD